MDYKIDIEQNKKDKITSQILKNTINFSEKYSKIFELSLVIMQIIILMIQTLTIKMKFVLFIIINLIFIYVVQKYDKRKIFNHNLNLITFAIVLDVFSYYAIFDTFYYSFDYKWLIDIILSFSSSDFFIMLIIIFAFYFLTLKYIIYNKNRKEWIKKDKIRNILMAFIISCCGVFIYLTFYNVFFVDKEVRIQKIYNNGEKEKVLARVEGNIGVFNECKIYKDIGGKESIIIFEKVEEHLDLNGKKTEYRNFRKVEKI